MPAREVPFVDGMKLGLGYDVLAGQPLTTPAVLGSSISAIPGARGQQVTSQTLIIEDLESLHKSLGVSVDAGGSYMGFDASAKVDFVSGCDFNSFSTFLLVSVTVEDAFDSIDSPALTSDASELIQNNDGPRFRARFGDVFIDGVKRGGEYYAIYEISGSDREERQSVAVQVQASFSDILASAHLNTDISSKTSSSSSHLTVRTHVFQQGSIDHTDTTFSDILDKARNFPPSVAGNLAFPYAVSLADYATLKLPSDKFNAIDIENQQQVLEDLARKRFQFVTLGNDIDYILSHSDDFDSPDIPGLQKMHSDVVNALNTMVRQASACSKDAGQCVFTAFDINQFVLPKPKTPTAAVRVPPLVGLPLGAAMQVGFALSLTVKGRQGVFHSTIGLSMQTVETQDPAAGTLVPPGTVVMVTTD